MRAEPVDRATFLAQGGLLVVAFALPNAAAAQQAQSPPGSGQREAAPQGRPQYPNVDSWLAIERNGDVTVFFGKAELGTGTETALAQLVADDLDVSLERVRVVQPDTARTPNQGYTAGSQTLTTGALPVRHAAATARMTLLALAAERLKIPVAQLETHEGTVVTRSSDVDPQPLGYGELIGGSWAPARRRRP